MSFHEYPQELEFARSLWRRISDSILELESFVAKNPDSTARTLLTDISTHVWQITREFFVLGRASDWSLQDVHLSEMVRVCFGTPVSTKASLESAFNDLVDKGRQAKANKMSPYTRWSYLALNPYAKTGGINTLKVSTEDFMAAAQYSDDYQLAKDLPHFSGARSAELPANCPTKKELKDHRIYIIRFFFNFVLGEVMGSGWMVCVCVEGVCAKYSFPFVFLKYFLAYSRDKF